MDFPEFFGDDYFQDDSVNEDSFEDNLEAEMDEPLTGDAELEGEPIEAESEDYDFTVKDAFFLGGAMKLRAELAEAAIGKEVAEPLKLELEQAAFSIWTTVNVDMVSAIEDITVWQGIDPREYLFVSGGGAAGLHVIPMIQELGAREILIPKADHPLADDRFSMSVRCWWAIKFNREPRIASKITCRADQLLLCCRSKLLISNCDGVDMVRRVLK